MKLFVNRILCVLLALTIVAGYTGVPVYKMICTEDGHTVVSISKDDDGCHHKTTLDCCSPKHVEQKTEPAESCCANSSNFIKLHESTEVYPQQTQTGHLLTSVAILFAPLAFTQKPIEVIGKSTAAPPLLSRKQPAQSFTQVFLIWFFTHVLMQYLAVLLFPIYSFFEHETWSIYF